jgi:glycosyltransferase involved in cell wall biosynthesis
VSSLVSLVMPAWQTRREWLLAAVTSALDEDETAVELLVVDDGSAQPVDEVLRSVEDDRLRILRIEHSGPYAARNAGIAEANGDWIRFVDSDDVVFAGSTGRLMAAAAGERVIPYGVTVVSDEELRPQRLIASRLQGDVEVDCLLGRFDVRVVSMLFPRAVVAEAGPWDPTFRVSGDWDFVLRAVERAPVRPVDLLATRYRRHGSSVTRTSDVAAGERARARVVAGYLDRHPAMRRSRLARRARAAILLDSARGHIHHGATAAGLARLARAAGLRPFASAATAAGLIRPLASRQLRSHYRE